MRTTLIRVDSRNGLHLRVAAKIVDLCKRYKATVVLVKGSDYAEGSSILQLLELAATEGSEVRVIVVGEDEERVIRELPQMFTGGGGI
jgi:phosphocarrier protein